MNKTRPNLHFQKENTYTYQIWIALIPLLCYGFYKNGILPFLNQDANVFQMLRPILFPLIGILIGCVIDYFIWKKGKKEQVWTNMPLYGLLTAMTIPLGTNPLVFAFLLAIIFLITRKIKWKINPLFLSVGLFAIIFPIICNASFANISEKNHTFIYSIVDIFFGRNTGGVFTTSIFWTVLSFLYLCMNPYYKKEIPLYLIGTFCLLTFVFEMILPTEDFLKSLLNSSVFFGSVFISSEMYYSPYTEKGKIIYSISTGILGFFLTRFLSPISGIYISILIISFFVPFIDDFAVFLDEKKNNFCRMKKMELPKQKNEKV